MLLSRLLLGLVNLLALVSGFGSKEFVTNYYALWSRFLGLRICLLSFWSLLGLRLEMSKSSIRVFQACEIALYDSYLFILVQNHLVDFFRTLGDQDTSVLTDLDKVSQL